MTIPSHSRKSTRQYGSRSGGFPRCGGRCRLPRNTEAPPENTQHVPRQRRAEVLTKALNAFGISAQNLPTLQQYNLAQRELDLRTRKSSLFAIVAVIAMIIFGIITIFAMI
jgi:hypothetical protein